jgi:signal transduction histidine kinase
VEMPEDCHAGVGMNSMHERAEKLGGTCEVTSAPAGGTRVLARLPLPAARKEYSVTSEWNYHGKYPHPHSR